MERVTAKQTELRAIRVGIGLNLLMGAAGFIVYQVSGVQALLLDSFFTLISVFSGVAAAVISKISARKSNAFPYGLYALEPIYVVLKSLLILFLMLYTTVTVSSKALAYYLDGSGEVMLTGPIVPYGAVMALLCGLLYFFYSRQNRQIYGNSIILQVESKAALIDGMISAGIGIAALLISFIEEGSPLSFLLYTGDFYITLLLVLVSVKEPVLTLKEAFTELASGIVTNEKVRSDVESCVSDCVAEVFFIRNCLVHKVGMSLRITIEISSDSVRATIHAIELGETVKLIQDKLKERYGHTFVSFAFV